MMNLYNELIAFSESKLINIDLMLTDAKYFRLPGGSADYQIDSSTIDLVNFKLPWYRTIVEDDESLVFLVDYKKDVKGFNQPRLFLEVGRFDDGDIFFAFGFIYKLSIESKDLLSGQGALQFVYGKEKNCYYPMQVDKHSAGAGKFIQDAYIAVRELLSVGEEIYLYCLPVRKVYAD